MLKRANSLLHINAFRWILMGVAQVSMFAIAGFAAFLLRFDFQIPTDELRLYAYAVPLWILVRAVSFMSQISTGADTAMSP